MITIPVNYETYFDVAEGLHWFCVDNHAGQASRLYAVLCELDFTPSFMSHEAESEDGQIVYDLLTEEMEQSESSAEDAAEELLAQIKVYVTRDED